MGRVWAGGLSQRLLFAPLCSSLVGCFCWGIISVRSVCHKQQLLLRTPSTSRTTLALSAMGTRMQDALLGPGCKMLCWDQDARCCVGTRMQDAKSCADVLLLRDEGLLKLRWWVLCRCPRVLTWRMPKTVTSTGWTSCTPPHRCLKASLMAALSGLGAAGIVGLLCSAQSAPS